MGYTKFSTLPWSAKMQLSLSWVVFIVAISSPKFTLTIPRLWYLCLNNFNIVIRMPWIVARTIQVKALHKGISWTWMICEVQLFSTMALLPMCLSNFKKVYTWILRLRDFTRSCGKTSVHLVTRGPDAELAKDIHTYPSPHALWCALEICCDWIKR